MGEYYGVRREGEPYIEHFLPKGWKKAGAKYIARIKNAAGDGYRYIYKQSELAAAQGRKAAKAVGNITKDTYKVVRKGVNDVATSAKKSLGVYARRDMNRKWDALRTGDPRSKANANKFDRFMNSRKAYEKTPMGRLESLKNRAVEGAQQAYYQAEKSVNKAAKQARKTVNKVRRNAESAYKDAKKNVSNTADQVGRGVDRAIRSIDNKYGITDSGKRAKKASDYKQKMIDRRNSLSHPDRVDANDAARAGRYAGHGSRNRDTVEYKNSLNLRRAKTRVHRGVQKEQMARNREETQQARVAGIRGNGLMATKVAGAFGHKNGDEFNKDKPVTMKSKKARAEQSQMRNAKRAKNQQARVNERDQNKAKGKKTGQNPYAWTRTPPETSQHRRMRPGEFERGFIKDNLRAATSPDIKKRRKRAIGIRRQVRRFS